MIMQVHDELVFEVPLDEVEWLKVAVPRLMAGVADLKVPLLAELGAAGQDLVRSRYSREASLAAWMAAFRAVEALPELPPAAAGPAPAAAGGLDRLLGPGPSQAIRRLLRRGFRHGEAGSEWPHSGHPATGQQALLEWAAQLDHHG
jgi:hypothetical protein